MKGSGIPVTGIMPRVMPTLMKIWKEPHGKDPTGEQAAEGIPEEREIMSVLYKRTKNKKENENGSDEAGSSPMTEKMKSV